MRTSLTALVLAWLAAGASLGWSAGQPARSQPSVRTEKEASVKQAFDRKVAEYVALHRELEGTVPTVGVSEDPEEVRAAMDALAAKIRSARRGAPEDFFPEEATRLFRRWIGEGCAGDYETLRQLVMEEAPPNIPEPTVNGRWPRGVPFSLITPDLLCALPELPPELEYRFISHHLVLYDTHADLIVDVLRNAIPPPDGR